MSDNPLEQFINKKAKRAEKYREIIEEMMCDYSAYNYAESTLLGILEFIDEEDNITDAQVQAVKNIRKKPSEGYGR